MFSPRAVQVPTPLSSFRKKKAIPHHRRFPHINSSFPEIGLFCLYPTHIEEFIWMKKKNGVYHEATPCKTTKRYLKP